ncbi:uncharacterized protein LOC143453222 [Clavelina lepadiformis]|uniref:uncharacterized protein LOC143453222 n=1 Tax=Clavelina lepadiformis TaxID=159417 RepID=UPI00404311C3
MALLSQVSLALALALAIFCGRAQLTEAVAFILPSLSQSFRFGRVDFQTRYPQIPEVYAWARPPNYLSERSKFAVDILSVTTRGFNYKVKCLGSCTGWPYLLRLYWSIYIKPYSTFDWESSLGHKIYHTYHVPQSTWWNTPAITEVSENVFDIFGRDIHFSVVYKLLNDVTERRFPVTQTTGTEAPFEVSLRGDCVYLDRDITFQGLRKLTVLARKFVSNDKTLTLKAPQAYERIEEARSLNGAEGMDGIASTLVDIYVQSVEGNMNIVSQASNGSTGGNGGDGPDGEDKSNIISSNLRGVYDNNCNSQKGDPGPNGGNGKSGGVAGRSGRGGTCKTINLKTQHISGEFEVSQRSGRGGSPAEHGFSGSGGRGGKGGCGIAAFFPEVRDKLAVAEGCVHARSCRDLRGDPGQDGNPGVDAFQLYPAPRKGPDGNVEQADLRKVGSLKKWFANDEELLNLIHRKGEQLFLKNKSNEAADIFSFLLSVISTTSLLHQKVLLRKRTLEQGFDYYGNSDIYAPTLGWTYLESRATSLLEAGGAFESAYNNVKDKIENVKLASRTMRRTVMEFASASKTQHQHDLRTLDSEENLYFKSLFELEVKMTEERLQIANLIPGVIKQVSAEEISKGINSVLDFFGALLGFIPAVMAKNPQLAFNSPVDIYRIFSKSPGCSSSAFNELRPTLRTRLNFALHSANADNFDISTMDISAVPIIMRSELGKNKGKFLQDFGCLFDRETKSDLVRNFERVLNDFFRDGDLRITIINKLINLNLKKKKVAYNLEVLNQMETNVRRAALYMSQNSVSMSIKRNFGDLLYNAYQQYEVDILHSLYELSKSYQFMSLWKFDVLASYDNRYGDISLVSQVGSLNSMSNLMDIRSELERHRSRFLDTISKSAGAASHTFSFLREFNRTAYPGVFRSLHNESRFTVTIDLDPNDIAITGCDTCYNARLISIYVEITGSQQPTTVSSRIYLRISHLGDSYFLLPLPDGNKTVLHFQQKPEDIDGGSVLYFDQNESVTSEIDPLLNEKFQQRYSSRYCSETDNRRDFFGGRMCKSPYATYTITVPRSEEACGDHISASNCESLDVGRFEKIRIFMKIRAWTSYSTPPHLQ